MTTLCRPDGFSLSNYGFRPWRIPFLCLSFVLTLEIAAVAGGSGFNVIVIANQNSPDSLALANYYCEKRQVPPNNVLRIPWTGGNTTWTRAEFESILLNPLLAAVAARGLSNQIDFAALSMDIPFAVAEGDSLNSTTSVLFYGFKGPSGTDQRSATNSYAGAESVFRVAKPASAPGFSFLATMITAGSADLARRIVDQGIASDGTLPVQSAWLAKTTDPLRNQRYRAFDNAIFNARICGDYSLQRTNLNSPWGQTNLFGYQTGLANFSISPNCFVPGAMADSMTSFGGVIFGPNNQTSLLGFIHAGASGSYGAVTEPQPVAEKFPDPQNYFFQSRGFSLAECYYQSVANPHQGLIVGEPLAAPFRRALTGNWVGLATNAVFSGATNLGVRFLSVNGGPEVQRVDLFLDGAFLRTLTNIPPRSGNELSVTLNGQRSSYLVPANASVNSIAQGLAGVLNDPASADKTQVVAIPHGDRIELQSLQPPVAASTFQVIYYPTGMVGSPLYYQAQRVPARVPASLAAQGKTGGGGFKLSVNSPAGVPYSIQASGNLADWVSIYSSPEGGPLEFTDAFARFHARRFYRIVSPSVQSTLSRLLPLGRLGSTFGIYADAAVGCGYVIEASTDLLSWSALATNLAGGPMEFQDQTASQFGNRFYRLNHQAAASRPVLRLLGKNPDGAQRLRVESSLSSPYVLQASDDLAQWADVLTNSAGGNLDFVDAGSASRIRRFFRTRTLGSVNGPTINLVSRTLSGGDVLNVFDATGDYVVVWVSTNLVNWSPIATNFARLPMHAQTDSAASDAGPVTSFVRAPRTPFMDSIAFGTRSFAINGTLQNGDILRLLVAKTNGSLVEIAVTNQDMGSSVLQFIQVLTNAIGTCTALQGGDGLVAEDLMPGFQGLAMFNLRARSAGYSAAGIRVGLSTVGASFVGLINDADLRENVADLRPRNHLYVTAGVTNLLLPFTLDTTSLENGWHDLTAVAYEGSHVQTQTRLTVPVRITNAAFSATLTITNATTTLPLQVTIHPLVTTTGSATITNISLFSTGGLIASKPNQPTAGFDVAGATLGAGSHSLYAIISASTGKRFRTSPIPLRLMP